MKNQMPRSLLDVRLLKQELLVEKLTCRVVIFERQARACNTIIIRGIVYERDGCLSLGAAHISDLDGERLCRREDRGKEQNYSAHSD
jgi:hypothetical protein